MKFQIALKPRVEKELEKLPKADYYRILSAFSILSNNPFIGKKMLGEYYGCYSYRVWPYRIIYQIEKKQLFVLVLQVGHRQGIYK
ncbi:MAG: type II toxin-antitoxin system RelE/ParE family toxin [Candidatus Roizmanbacteria bacterium]|nr:type II toxin-antitoxin system RelE/ParE family toxin [Candidatus Roizmanbacteria bacterium]